MSFATVRFFNNIPVDKNTGNVPIFTNATTESAVAAGTHATYPAAFSWTDVKVRRDAGDQIVQLPVDATDITNFEKCNIAVIIFSNYHRWYWIDDFMEITNSAYPTGTVNRLMYEIRLQYLPITTGMNLSTSLTIIPERLPTFTARVMQNWTESTMFPATTTTALPNLPTIGTIKKKVPSGSADFKILWCEITVALTSSIARYGMFITTKIGSGTKSAHVFAGMYNQASRYDIYPTLEQLIEDPLTYINRPTATVTDINISEFCPYKTFVANTNVAGEEYITLITENGNEFAGNNTYTNGNDHYYTYYLNNNEFAEPGASQKKLNKGTLSISLSDFEKCNGQLFIKDTLRNDVMMISKDAMDNTMTIDYKVFSDSSNIYASFEFKGGIVTLSGYKIPWITSMWDQYRAYNLQFDRQALQNNIDAANNEMNISMIENATNGLIGGALVGAMRGGVTGLAMGVGTGAVSLGTSFISADMRRQETIRKLERDQELTEQRMRAGPGTMNNTSASMGIINSINEFGGAEFIFKLPDSFTDTQWGYQTALWGYPSNKVQTTQTVSVGYWKGKITSATGTMNNTSKGVLFNMMIEAFDNGLRLVKIV